jgi:hypothetical protein
LKALVLLSLTMPNFFHWGEVSWTFSLWAVPEPQSSQAQPFL